MSFAPLRTLLLAGAGAALCGQASAEWTRTYVVDWFEPANYYGAKEGPLEPGTDCPKGANPEVDWVKVLIKAGYTPAEANWLRDPANPSRSPVHGQNQMAFRGKDRANVYIHPESYPDPGLVTVEGKVAEGFNLDGDAKTGLTSPTGEAGIDNSFYRALGCLKSFRGPQRLSTGAISANDTMRNGSWAQLIVVHGAGNDPMNDPNVDVGIYMAADPIVKDANSEVTKDYTFRIKPAKLEAIFKASTSKGVITSKNDPEVWLHDAGATRDLQLLKAKLKLEMAEDGSLKGMVGGYRPWDTIWRTMSANRGPVVEVLGWYEIPGVYYALKRNADYAPTPGGEKTHISYAMRINAVPAFVAQPDGKQMVSGVVSYVDKAPKTDWRGPDPAFGAIDGMVPDRNVPFGKALELYPVPGDYKVAGPAPAKAGGGQ